MFLNLVINAGQAIADQGSVVVRTEATDDAVFAWIEDDGGGVSPELIDRIFDPFFTTKPVGEGTGLGLGIALEIGRKQRGEISVESRRGGGAVFCVRLPVSADTIASS